jgi:hypothetical protein
MYDYYPSGYGYRQGGSWPPSGFLHGSYGGSPIGYPPAGMYNNGYYDQSYYMDYNRLGSPFPVSFHGGGIARSWDDPYYGRRGSRLFGSLFGTPGRRYSSPQLSYEQLQEEQLRTLRRHSRPHNLHSSHKHRSRSSYSDGKRRT